MIHKLIRSNALYFAWAVALVGMLGSIYASNILHWLPCNLCWYQRIFLYPLVLIIGIGILRKSDDLEYYVLPFSILGGLVALYHELIQIGIIPEKLLPCTYGVSCTTKYINLYGFITIPLLSLAAFILISICIIIYMKEKANA